MNLQALTRHEIIELTHQKTTWTGKEVRTALSSMRIKNVGNITPENIRIGDVFGGTFLNHPCIVIKMTKTHIWRIALTTNPKCSGVIMPCISRWFPTSWFTSSIIQFQKEEIVSHIVGTFDNRK
jgi:hypothetical protein